MHVLVIFLRNIMGSAAETEIGASYENGTAAIPMRVALIDKGNPQPPTTMQLDNTKAVNFSNDELNQKCTKATDIRFYWIKDRTKQKKLMVYWIPGKGNLGDNHSKNHPTAHHRLVCPIYLNRE